MQFSDAHKREQEFGNYFGFGVHKVQILGFNHGVTDAGKEYIEVGFTDESGEIEDKARVWFTTDQAVEISFSTLRSILVHNVAEANKDKAREAVNAVKNPEELAELLNSKLIGKEMWFTKYLDAKGRTYTDQNGTERPSINKNIHGYEPKLKPELMPKPDPKKDKATPEVAGEVFGKEEGDVPFKGGGSKDEDWA